MKYWLLKSEPDVFSIDDMANAKKTLWENVRNYQARNFMVDGMNIGDLALFYHSNANPAAVAGIVEISGAARPDPSQFDAKSEYYEPKATKEKPIWQCVEVAFKQKFKAPISLDFIKTQKNLEKMVLLNNSRLSVQPVSEKQYNTILKLAEKLAKES